jgi:hypothetical protein
VKNVSGEEPDVRLEPAHRHLAHRRAADLEAGVAEVEVQEGALELAAQRRDRRLALEQLGPQHADPAVGEHRRREDHDEAPEQPAEQDEEHVGTLIAGRAAACLTPTLARP